MNIFRKIKYLDSFCPKENKAEHFDLPLVKFVRKKIQPSQLFHRSGRTTDFTTGTLNIHFVKNAVSPNFKNMDGFLTFQKPIPPGYAFSHRKDILNEIEKRYGDWKGYFKNYSKEFFQNISAVKAWNLSIIGSVILGMFLMTFVYRYLGQEAAAEKDKQAKLSEIENEMVLGASDKRNDTENYVLQILESYQKEKEDYEAIKEKMQKMVEGYPIEEMIPFIAKQDKLVAAFLISIAKKESAWGKHAPVLDGEDCFNYWGYRGIRKRMGTDGHTCFDSREDAVKTVAKRIKNIIEKEKISTPKEMVTVWKCGYDCSWDDPKAVKKWISDVDHYFKEFDD
jgi:hypothetical protein